MSKPVNSFKAAKAAYHKGSFKAVANFLNERKPFVTAQLIHELIKETATLNDAEEIAKNIFTATFDHK